MNFINHYFYVFHLPPLLAPLIFFMTGIIFHSFISYFFIFFLLLSSSFFLYYLFKKLFFLQTFICSFFLLFGAWLHQKHIQDYYTFYYSIENKNLHITGMVTDMNNVIIRHKKMLLITIHIDEIATENTQFPMNKNLLLYTKSNKNICVGDIIVLYDVSLKKPSSEDFQKYQIKEHSIATLFNDNLRYSKQKDGSNSWRYWLWHHKQRLLTSLSEKLSADTFRFFSSLFLGNRLEVKESLEETNEQFKIWGISHFLARSGLHLAIFIFILNIIFCIIPLSLRLKQSCLVVICVVYFLLSWIATPFARSFALFILGQICLLNKISFHLLHYVILVCFCFLLYSPLYLFFLDFQLTFILTFALGWFNQVTSIIKTSH